MRIVFFGTPLFAVASLQALLRDRFTVSGVVTQPDKPQGRSRSELVAPPVKIAAQTEGLPVLQPVRPVGDVFAASLRRLEPDLGVVVAYGHILRPEILAIPSQGMINVHASLLPRHRGAAPIQHAILQGDTETGISIIQMEEGLDSGPVLHRLATVIRNDETAGSLSERLADLGASALVEALSLLAAGLARPQTQDHSGATYAPKLDRDVARIIWQGDGLGVARHVRAFDPAPGAWTTLEGSPLKLFEARPAAASGKPGQILASGDRLVIAAGTGAVEVAAVQPAGKPRMPAAAWARGRGISAGQQLI